MLHNLHIYEAKALTHGFYPGQMQLYSEYYAALNPWLPVKDATPTDGPVVRSEAIFSPSRLRRTEFHAGCGKRTDVVNRTAVNLKISDGRFLYLTINRGEKKGTHPESAELLLTLLIPHLQRAIRNQLLFESAPVLIRTLSEMDVAVIVVVHGYDIRLS